MASTLTLPTQSQFFETLSPPAQLTEDEQVCYICSYEYGADHQPITVHDNHIYCHECVEAWLQEHNTCPTCRKELFREDIISPDLDGSWIMDNTSDAASLATITDPHSPYRRALLAGQNGERIRLTFAIYANHLARRHEDFTNGVLELDVEYRAVGGDEPEEPIPVALLSQAERPLHTKFVAMMVWLAYFSRLSMPSWGRVYSAEQHPWAVAMVIDLLIALGSWEGSLLDPPRLKLLLEEWCRAWEQQVFEARNSLPIGWQGFKDKVIGWVVEVHGSDWDPELKAKIEVLAMYHEGLC